MAAAAEGKQLAVATSKKDIAVSDVHSALDQKVLETPRTMEACRKLGLVIEDLQIRSPDSFYVPGDIKGKQKLRFDHYEKKRKDRYSQVLAERAKVITQNLKKGEVPGVQSAQFLGMLESLFEKEAKRLEVDLKGQLRQHSSLVKENEEQLQKEGKLADNMILQEQRRQRAQHEWTSKGTEAQDKAVKRKETNLELMVKIENDFREKQEKAEKAISAEEERMMHFQHAKSQENGDKAMVFREKVDNMKKKSEHRMVEKRIEGENRLTEIGRKIAQVEKNRTDEQESRMMQSEEQHLHIMDVRDNKNRLERKEGHRREELREQIDSNVERIETLLALKDQLLDQRRARNTKAEATKGSRGLNLRRDCAPGPGQYEAQHSSLLDGPGVKIAQSKVPGMVDDAIKAVASNPAPGAYDALFLANGDRVDKGAGNGGKFSDQQKTSYLDDACKAKGYIPAPGRYDSKSALSKQGPKIARARIGDAKSMGAFGPQEQTPGPAGYNVDDYHRKEVLRRAQRSLPNLTRDMLKPGKLNVKT